MATIQETIGGLKEAVNSLKESIGELREAVQIRDSERRIDWQDLYRRLDQADRELQARFRAVEQAVAELHAAVNEMKPAVADWNKIRTRAEGAHWLAGHVGAWLYAAGGAVLVAGWWLVSHLWPILTGKP